MADIDVDVLVLGWGKGGKTLAGALGRAGRRVAVVERSAQMVGGSCININCVPTKALVHDSARWAARGGGARAAQRDAESWFTESVSRRDALVEKLRARNRELLEVVDAVTLIDGEAAFIGPRLVESPWVSFLPASLSSERWLG